MTRTFLELSNSAGAMCHVAQLPVETSIVVYRCKTCSFESTDPDLAANHDLEENRGRRRDSQWRHQVEVVATRDLSTPACPVCGGSSYKAPDLKTHLAKEHGSNPDALIKTILALRDQNIKITGVSRSLHAQVGSLMRHRLPGRATNRRGASKTLSLDDDSEEGS